MKTVGVKLFRGIVDGGIVPIGETVTSGFTILITVPGVEAGIVEILAGIKSTGICRLLGNKLVSVIVPTPVTASVSVIFVSDGTLLVLDSMQNAQFMVKFSDLWPTDLTTLQFDATPGTVDYLTAEVSFKYTLYDIVNNQGIPL